MKLVWVKRMRCIERNIWKHIMANYICIIGSNLIWRGKEGYCRRNLKEYLNFLNIALASCGELFSGIISFKEIKVLTEEEFEKIDELHFKVENELIALIKSLQKKQKEGNWQTEF